jgi:hypothetical protein
VFPFCILTLCNIPECIAVMEQQIKIQSDNALHIFGFVTFILTGHHGYILGTGLSSLMFNWLCLDDNGKMP